MKERNPHDALMALVKQHGTQHAAAKALGVGDVYVSDLLNGRRKFSDEMLAKLGLRRIVVAALKVKDMTSGKTEAA